MTTKVMLSLNDGQGSFVDLWDGGDEPILRRIRRDLTAGEVSTLSTVPVQLLPGQPGKVYWPISGVLLYAPGSTPYADGAGYLEIGQPGTPVVHFIASLDAVFAATEASLLPMFRAYEFPGTPLPLALAAGAPLMAWAEADPTGGDGTLDIGILYRVLTIQ